MEQVVDATPAKKARRKRYTCLNEGKVEGCKGTFLASPDEQNLLCPNCVTVAEDEPAGFDPFDWANVPPGDEPVSVVRQKGRRVPEQTKSPRHYSAGPGQQVCCINCGAPAGEVQLKLYDINTAGEKVYLCAGGCAKQRNKAIVRLVRRAARGKGVR